MVDVLAAPQQGKADSALRTLTGISIAHWVSHFHLLVLPMLFPFLKAQLGVGYIELGFALTVFAVVSGLTQAPTGYLVDQFWRATNSAGRPHARRLRADPARSAPQLRLADRLRRAAGSRQ
ncbi:MFS family permease [Bradyrhizobium ottawaense]